MLYQLPDGRSIEMSVEDYLYLTENDLKSLTGYDLIGYHHENPFHGSAITKTGLRIVDRIDNDDENDDNEEYDYQDDVIDQE